MVGKGVFLYTDIRECLGIWDPPIPSQCNNVCHLKVRSAVPLLPYLSLRGMVWVTQLLNLGVV